MLNATDISQRIQNPQLVDKKDLESLSELAKKYPYTQIFSILYLKGLSQTGNIQFEEELKKHSYRISDRVQLYHLINDHDSTSTNSSKPTEEIPEIEETTPKTLNEETPAAEEEHIQTSELDVAADSEVEEVEIQLEEESTKIEDQEEKQEVVLESELELIEDDLSTEDEEPIVPKDKLDENILHHAFASNYQLDELTQDELDILESRETEKEIEEEVNVEVAPAQETTEKPVDNTSFTGWLHADTNYEEQDNSDKEAINAVVEDFADFDPMIDLFGETEKPKTEFFSPTKKAKESLDEEQLPVSETLAKIYVVQGNYPKAIAAYQELSLAFPEKTTFFANLIEDLKKKLNT
jgi:hypothetical protein